LYVELSDLGRKEERTEWSDNLRACCEMQHMR